MALVLVVELEEYQRITSNDDLFYEQWWLRSKQLKLQVSLFNRTF